MRIATLAVVLAALGAPALASPQSDLAAAYASRLAHGTNCGWLTPAQSKAIRLNAEEQVANALAIGGEAAGAEAQAAFDAAMRTEKPCTPDERIGMTAYARTIEGDWVIRAVALLDAEAKEPHTANFSTVARYAPALRAGFEALPASSNKEAYKRAYAVQADAAIRRLCPGRMAPLSSTGYRGCPPGAPDDAQRLPASRAFVEGVGAFAVLYAPPTATAAAAPKTHTFKVDAKHPLARLTGKPLWQVYNDCSWAMHNAAGAVTVKPIAAQPDADPWSMESFQAEADGFASFNRTAEYIERGQALTEKAIDAYAAQTGKPRAEAEKFVKNANATMELDANQCAALK